MLCMTLLVRDEESIVRENIEYHLSRGVDIIIATDNLSKDGTTDILREYERIGCLHYIFEGTDDYSQDLWVTRMARIAAEEYDAEWIIHVDADEFWWPERDSNLNSVFARVGSDIHGLYVRRSNFFCLRNGHVSTPFYNRMQYRDTCSTNPLGAPLPPKIAHRADEEVLVSQGNHSFTVGNDHPKMQECSDINIFHFPMRDYEEFQHKIRVGGRAYSKNSRLPDSAGNTWRVLYEKARMGQLGDYFDQTAFSLAELKELAKNGRAEFDTRLASYIERHIVDKP